MSFQVYQSFSTDNKRRWWHVIEQHLGWLAIIATLLYCHFSR